MKVFYQNAEIGIMKDDVTIGEMFKTNLDFYKKHIVAGKINNEIKSLDTKVNDGDKIDLIDITDKDGMKIYIRGLLFVMGMAFNELYPESYLNVNFQLSNSMFCQIDNMGVTEEMIEEVKEKMQELINADLKIRKVVMTHDEAVRFYQEEKTIRGILQIDNKNKENVSLYFCNDYYNYFYGVMPSSTGVLDLFDIKLYRHGFIVQYPSRKDPTQVGEFKESKKFLSALKEYDDINALMNINTIYHLNNRIKDGKTNEVILMSEALHEKKIAEIADKIAAKKGIKLVLIAGPSSSGKTTFAKRLGIQLRINGLKPVTIGTDNYFVERPDTPLDENGDYDFETIDALDLNLFNDHLTKLIEGEEIEVPTFDFKIGSKKFLGNKMSLKEDEVLVIEGIHCLNDKLTASIPDHEKFKIYISDLTVLNIDYFNRISTTDTRLIRRIVRDHNFRGYSALETLKRWPSVNAGEDKNIFPFQENADVMFNSSLVYELAILSKYALPLLEEIDSSEKEYSEAKRLIAFLKYFEEIDDERAIPMNSILREFVDGSIFDY